MLSASARKAPTATMASSTSSTLISMSYRRAIAKNFRLNVASSSTLSSISSSSSSSQLPLSTRTTTGVTPTLPSKMAVSRLVHHEQRSYIHNHHYYHHRHQFLSKNHDKFHSVNSTTTQCSSNNNRPYGSLSTKVAEIAAAAAASFTENDNENNNKTKTKKEAIRNNEKKERQEFLQELLESPELFTAQLDLLVNGRSKKGARTAESLLFIVVDSYLKSLELPKKQFLTTIMTSHDDDDDDVDIGMDVLPPLPAGMEERMYHSKKKGNYKDDDVGGGGAFSSQNFNPKAIIVSSKKRRRRQEAGGEESVVENVKVKPTSDLFLKCIKAWKTSNSKVAPERAEDLLIALCDLYALTNNNDPSLRPTTEVFNAVMDCWPNSHRGKEAAVRCEHVLQYMNVLSTKGGGGGGGVLVKPDTSSFGIVLDAWAKASYLERGKDGYECAKRAEEVLEWMERLRQFSSSSSSSLTTTKKDQSSSDNNYYSKVKPNTQCFASVINAWAYRCTPGSAVRAMRIFDLMLDLYESGDESVKPNTRAYYAVLSAWARSGGRNSADKAEDILRHMDALARAGEGEKEGNVGGGDNLKVSSLLSVRPNVHCFNAVMMAHAYSRGGIESAQKAEVLLDWMEELYLNGDEEAKPDTKSYRLVMSAWAWSRSHDAPSRTESILQRMIAANRDGNYDVIPCVRDFNTVISCCAYGHQQQQSDSIDAKEEEEKKDVELLDVADRGEGDPLRVAFSTLDALGEFPHCSANSTTFATLIQACAAHLPQGAERNLWVQELFQTCSDLELVDGKVLRQLRRAVPKDHYISLREEHENFRLSSKPEDLAGPYTIQEEEDSIGLQEDDSIESDDEIPEELVMAERAWEQ